MKKRVLAVLLSAAMDADQAQNQMKSLRLRQKQQKTQKKRQKTLRL